MSKKLKIALITTLVMLFSTMLVSADYVIFKNDVDVSIQFNDVSEIGTMSADEAAVDVVIDQTSNNYRKFEVYYSIDGGIDKNVGVYNIAPEKKETIKIPLATLDIGTHDLKLWVVSSGIVMSEIEEKIYIADLYEKQFMDFNNEMGINVHFQPVESQGYPFDSTVFKTVKAMGIPLVRNNASYGTSEPSPGKFAIESSIGWWTKKLQENGIDWSHTDFGLLHLTSDPTRMVPEDVRIAEAGTWNQGFAIRTQGGVNAFIKRGLEIMKFVPWLTEIEIWNEPGLGGFWNPGICKEYQSLTDLIKQAYIAYKDYRPEINFATFGHSVGKLHINFVYALMNGVYEYMDGYSYHPYIMGVPAYETYNSEAGHQSIKDEVLKYGGWKDFKVTEFGTANNYSIDEDLSSAKILKSYTEMDSLDYSNIMFYCLFNKTDLGLEDHETNYGMLTYYQKPKKQFYMIVNRNKKLAGAMFLGQIDLGLQDKEEEDTYAYVYIKDGKPVVMSWYYRPEEEFDKVAAGIGLNSSAQFGAMISNSRYAEIDWELPGESVTVTEMYGNVVSKDTSNVTLTYYPQYIEGLSENWVRGVMVETLDADYKDWMERFGEELPEAAKENAQKVLDDAINTVKNDGDLEATYDSLTKLGIDLIALAEKGEIEAVRASAMTFKLYESILHFNSYYAYKYDGEMPKKLSADRQGADKLRKQTYHNEGYNMPYAAAIWEFAERQYRVAEGIIKEEDCYFKTGALASYDKLTDMLYKWFVAMVSADEVNEYYRFFISVKDHDLSVFKNETCSSRFDLINKTKKDIKGHIEVYTEKGELVGKTESYTIPANTTDVSGQVNLKVSDADDVFCLIYHFINEEGETIKKQNTVYEFKESMRVEMIPADRPVEELTSIKFNVTNLQNTRLPVAIEVEGDEHISIASSRIETVMEPAETREIEIPVSSISHNKFHMYSINYKLYANGYYVGSGEGLLNFTVVTKTKKELKAEDFTGDISEWEDAYPIYLNAPINGKSKDDWKDSTYSARVLHKWDDDNLYYLVDIYDDAHHQPLVTEGIWNGDSIQMAYDPLKTGVNSSGNTAGGYDKDDTEIGVALTNSMIVTVGVWQNTPDKTAIEKGASIIRDKDAKITRYFVKVPKSAIPNLELKEGDTVRMDIGANDGDTYYRDRYIYFVKHGVTMEKRTSLFHEFYMAPQVEVTESSNSVATDIFPVTIKKSVL